MCVHGVHVFVRYAASHAFVYLYICFWMFMCVCNLLCHAFVYLKVCLGMCVCVCVCVRARARVCVCV